MYSDRDVDDFQRGLSKLRNGKLRKWAVDTTHTCTLGTMQNHPMIHIDEDEDIIEELGHDSQAMPENMTFGFIKMINGELVIETSDRTDLNELIEQLELEVAGQNEDDAETALDGMDID